MASIQLRDNIAHDLHKIAASHRLSVEALLTALVDGTYTQNHHGGTQVNIQNSALDAASSGIVIVDATLPNQPIIYANQAFEHITGYTANEVIGENCRFLQGNDRDQPELDRLRDAIKAGETCTVVVRNYHKNGTPFWNELKVSPVHDATGRLTHFIGVQHDITDRVQAQTALRESERRYRAISELSFDYAFAMRVNVDGTTETEWATNAFEQVTGYTPEESAARGGWIALMHPDDLPEAMDKFRQLITDGRVAPLQYRLIAKDGSVRYIYGDYRAEHDPKSGRVVRILGIARDITNQTLYEMRLKESESRFRSLVSSIEDVIFTIDREGRHTGIYGQWLDKYNMSASDFIGKTQREIVGNFAGNIHEQANARAFAGETVTYEWQTRVNNAVLSFRVTLSPIRNTDDEIVEVVGVGHDITELKALEAERIETERLRIELDKERELLDLKHRFISMVSHEFRTPLSVIMSTSNMLERYYDHFDKSKFDQYIQRLIIQVQQMDTMLDDVLMLSKASADMLDFRPEPFRVQAFCEKLIEDQQLVDEGIHRIRLDVGNLPTYYNGDPSLIQHILSNLMSNARKYSPPETLIVLYVCCDGDSLIFEVSDQGIGIPEADQKHLFQPFHRATNTGEIRGTGLGLSIVKSCVDAHQGTIHYTKPPSGGTTFTVRLPGCSRT